MNKRILLVTPLYPPDIGGPATYTKLVEGELRTRGFDVFVISFGEVRHLPKGISHLALLYKILSKASSVDVIYAQDTVSVGLPSLIAAKLTGKKFMVRVPGDHAWEQSYQRFGVKDSIDEFQKRQYGFRTSLLRFVQGLVTHHADAVVTPSLYFKKLVSGWLGDDSHIHAIYNGVKNIELGKSKEEVRRELGIFGPMIFSAGRLEPWKGFDVLVEVASELRVKIPDIKFYIAGDGMEMDNLRSKIKKLKADNVNLLGELPRSEVFKYLTASDIFILNSGFESFSFQTVEAQMAGTLVAVANIGSLPELVSDGEDGVIFELNNKEEIKNIVEKFFADEKARARFGRKAQEKSKQFSVERTVNELIEAIESI